MKNNKKFFKNLLHLRKGCDIIYYVCTDVKEHRKYRNEVK